MSKVYPKQVYTHSTHIRACKVMTPTRSEQKVPAFNHPCSITVTLSGRSGVASGGELPSHRARHNKTSRGRWQADLLGLGADSVPDRVQLAPYNVIKALEQAVL